MLVDLHRIAAAQREARLGLAFKVTELAAGTGDAVGIARDPNGLKPPGPHIERDKPPMQGLALSNQQLDGFGRLDRSNHAGSGA